jgi:rare lipoprotein A
MGKRIVLIGLAVLMLLSALAEANARHSRDRQVGWASWYGAYHHGRQTASGERFSMWELTAAHRWLPLGTKALVTNLDTGQQVKVTITDRGPYVDPQHRIIDLSRAAAARVGLLQRGVAPVRVAVLQKPGKPSRPTPIASRSARRLTSRLLDRRLANAPGLAASVAQRDCRVAVVQYQSGS